MDTVRFLSFKRSIKYIVNKLIGPALYSLHVRMNKELFLLPFLNFTLRGTPSKRSFYLSLLSRRSSF